VSGYVSLEKGLVFSVPLCLCGHEFCNVGDKISLTAALRGDHRVQPELADHPQDGLDVTVRQRPLDAKQLADRHQPFTPQQQAKRFNLLRRPVRQVGQRSLDDLLALPPSFAEQNRRRGTPIGDRLDVHGHKYNT
jgi:hypothetical protein